MKLERARELLRAIDAGYACAELAAWPAVVLAELRRLIPCDLAAFNDIDPVHHRLVAELAPPQEVPPTLEEIWARHGLENAAYRRLVLEGDVGPLRLSDFMSQAELRATELYRLGYAPLGIRYQLAAALEAPQPRITAIALMRERRDFTNGEVELLGLIRPHLRRSYDLALAAAGLARPHEADGAAAERAGISVVTIDETATIVEITPRAAAVVEAHFGRAAPGDPTPGGLGAWAAAAVAARGPAFRVFATAAGAVRASVTPRPGGAIIIVDEQFNRATDPLPLSGRQREVLAAISGGVTNAEAAAELGVSPSTIANHLDAIYRRLGVRNRGAALALYEREGKARPARRAR